MKKFIITLFAVFYLGVSSGASLHFHYCMGQIIEWGFTNDTSESPESCSNCDLSKGSSEHCCKDRKQKLKVRDAQKAPLIIY